MKALPAAFFRRDPLILAPELLNRELVSDVDGERVVLRITEVEAYLGRGLDPGSHAFRGMTTRNASMFLEGGHLYVYRSYGIHWCANIVAGLAGEAGGVLLRAAEVVEGRHTAWSRRMSVGVVRRELDLARGPGRLGAAAGITGALDGIAVTDNSIIWIRDPNNYATPGTQQVLTSTRTGVSGAGAKQPYRYFLADNPSVSPHRPVKDKKPIPNPK